MVNETYDAIIEISDLQEKYEGTTNKDAYNGEILSIMLKYHVVTPETARSLIDSNKLNCAGAESILNTCEEEKND